MPSTYAMYSEKYVPGIHLTDGIVRNIFQCEIVSIARDKAYMGIWQLFGLVGVLGKKICSVYPQLGNPVVRNDLNRIIMPRETNIHYVDQHKRRHGEQTLGAQSCRPSIANSLSSSNANSNRDSKMALDV